MPGLGDNIDADIKAGRLWKARDRLQGARRTSPTNQRVLTRLGEVYFRMGDLPEAGRVWFLTSHEGPEWQAAEQAFYDRFGRKATNVAAALKVRGEIEDYPSAVQERLRALQRRLKEEGRFWEPRPRLTSEPRIVSAWRNRLTGALIGLVVLLLLAALGIGLYTMVAWILAAGAG